MPSNSVFHRDLIRSARIQFSPTTQSVKASALDKIVEQSIGIYGTEGLTVDEIVKRSSVFANGGDIPVVRHADVVESIDRLTASGRVRCAPQEAHRSVLTELAQQEFEKIRQDSESRAQRLATHLFADFVPDPAVMIAPFFEVLARVFARLGTSYVMTLKGSESNMNPITHDEIATAASAVAAQRRLSREILIRATIAFFSAGDPDSVTTKWNLAQNYYVAIALGLDASGALLSDQVLGRCKLYLDTNVVVEGLEATARFHGSFRALVRACRTMGITLKVWGGTLDELRRVVHYYGDLIQKVAGKIPPETESKVRGLFYQKYREAMRDQEGEVDIGKLFENLLDGRRILREEYGIEIEDDSVETEEARTKKLERDLVGIMELYSSRRRRRKSRLSALHDASLVDKAVVDTKGGDRCLVVTLDMVLSDVRLREHPGLSVAIGLDAFLQWISPFASAKDEEYDFSEIFSSALEAHLLPEETIFDVRDFRVFGEIDWDTKHLPAEDVENCVRHLKRVAPGLDPSKASDREKLHGEIARYFADPGRKHHRRLQEMEDALEEFRGVAESQRRALEDELLVSKQRVGELEGRVEEQERERDDGNTRLREMEKTVRVIISEKEKVQRSLCGELSNSQSRFDELERRFEEEQNRWAEERLIRSAKSRLALLLVIWMIGVGVVAVFAAVWGSGDNLYQKLAESWELLASTAGIPTVLGYPLLGKERMGALGKSIKRLLGKGVDS